MSWLQPQPYDRRLFDQLDLGSPFGRLCQILAPALRIEPRLLRNARQRYLPRSDASLENRLWFSRVIETRGTRSVNLRPGLARLLVDQIAVQGGTQGRERLTRICDFIAEQTRDWDELDRIEQSLRWAVRDDDQTRVVELLRDLLRRIGARTDEPSRTDLARWLKGALPPLQAATEAHRESGWLAQFAGAALGDTGIVLRGHGTPRAPMPGWLATLLPTGGGLTLGLRLGRSDEHMILECLAPEPGLPRLELFTPAPAPVHIECENPAQGSPGWVSLFLGCRIPVGRGCRALTLQTLDGRRFRIATREGSDTVSADYSPPRRVVLVCAPGDEVNARHLATLLERQSVRVRVELITPQRPDLAAVADPDEQLVALWSRHAASAIRTDSEGVRNVFSSPASGAAYRLLVGLDKTPLPEGFGVGGTLPARVDFSAGSADWGIVEAQAVLSALTSERTAALQVRRADNTVEEFEVGRLADSIAEAFPTARRGASIVATTWRARATALAEQVKANLQRRYPRGGIVDTAEIGDDVERALVQAGEHEAARAYAKRRLLGQEEDLGKVSVQAPVESEREQPTEHQQTAGIDIFLSYARADQSVARELARRLGDGGLRIFLDLTDLKGGDDWQQKIDQVIDETRCVVVLWSSAARNNDWVQAEISKAQDRDKCFFAALDDFANLPREFAHHASADLRGWPRDSEAEATFERFLTVLKDFMAAGAARESSPAGKPASHRASSERPAAAADGPLVFVSYAVENSDVARIIADRLLELGAGDVWLDDKILRAGEEWFARIEQAITECDFFLPLLSREADQRREGVFWEEWARASERALRVAGTFILPTLIDSDPESHYHYQRIGRERSSEGFFQLHFLRAPAGVFDASAEDALSSTFKHFRSERRTADVETDRLIAELDDPLTPPPRRLEIGDRLAELGDPRPGVGLDEQGLPDIDWVQIRAGPFLYGEKTETRELSDFRIARYPVTNAQYQAFIDADGYRDERWWLNLDQHIKGPEASSWAAPNRPKANVSWFEAIAYCRWLSARLRLELRLPTELEWEKAARGTDGREYPWGDGYREGYANLDERKTKAGSHYLGQTSAVGIYRQGVSSYGVMDASGNVWEWCLNEYDKPANTGLSGDASRVLRGGCWFYDPESCRAAIRLHNTPFVRNDLIGFRVCRGSPIDPLGAGALDTGAPER